MKLMPMLRRVYGAVEVGPVVSNVYELCMWPERCGVFNSVTRPSTWPWACCRFLYSLTSLILGKVSSRGAGSQRRFSTRP
jgi:hypothetical protein